MAGKKILVADDSLTIQKVIRLALSGDGYEIQTVSDGQEAIEQASLFRPDICIIDVSLPTKDAYQIRQEFMSKPDLRNIPVIMMSSAFEKVDEMKMNSLGFSGHLIKPFDPSHLRSTLLSVSNLAPKNDPIEESIKPEPAPAPSAVNKPTQKGGPIQFTPPTSKLSDAPAEDFSLEPSGNEVRSFDLDSELNFGGKDDIQELTKNTFEMSGLDQQEWGVIEPMKEEPLLSPDHSISHSPGNLDPADSYLAPQTVNVSQEEIEALVKSEIAKVLEQLQEQIKVRVQDIFDEEFKQYTQAKMPDLAEKVIKEEIHKLLNDPPA